MNVLLQCIRLALLRSWRDRGNVICLVLAISAMMLPLVVLLGLKFGILSSMKEELLQNPAASEIWFRDVVQSSPADVERYRAWPETGFILPCVSSAYSSVEVVHPADAEPEELTVDTTPTAAGDPLLTAGAVPIPEAGEVVLSESLAEQLSITPGATLSLRVWRNARREKLERQMRVVGILPRRFCQRVMLFAPAEFCVALEEFKVRGVGEPGAAAEVTGAAYDGLLLRGESLAELAALLKGGMPALNQETPATSDASLPEGTVLLHSDKTRFSAQQMQPLLTYSTGNSREPQLWVHPVKAMLVDGALQPREVVISCAMGEFISPSVCAAPPRLLVHPGELKGLREVLLQMDSPQGKSEFLCVAEESADVEPGRILAAPQLLALLHRANRELLIWNYREGGLRHPVVEFAALRMYAANLDAVEVLMKKLRSEGRDCRARLDSVHQVLQLERNLDLLFLLLSIGVGVGAVLAFGMSLFNAVELYRRDFALIQLMGAGRPAATLIPVTEAMVTTGGALLVSFIGFEVMRRVISWAFAGMTDAQSICRLMPEHWLWLTLLSLGAAWVASWAAALRVLRISPAEILRES